MDPESDADVRSTYENPSSGTSSVSMEGQLLLSSLRQLVQQVETSLLLGQQPDQVAAIVPTAMLPELDKYLHRRRRLNAWLLTSSKDSQEDTARDDPPSVSLGTGESLRDEHQHSLPSQATASAEERNSSSREYSDSDDALRSLCGGSNERIDEEKSISQPLVCIANKTLCHCKPSLHTMADFVRRLCVELASCENSPLSRCLPRLENDSSAAASLLMQLQTLLQQVRVKLAQRPGEEQERLEAHQELCRQDQVNAVVERDLHLLRDRLLSELEEQRQESERQEETLRLSIEQVKDEAQRNTNDIVETRERSIAIECAEYRLQTAKYNGQIAEMQKSLEQIREQHQQEIQALVEERSRAEARLLEWISKYDEEMISRQQQLDALKQQLDEQLQQQEHYEQQTAIMKPQFDRISEKIRQREALAVMEESTKRKKAAALVILKYWRVYKANKKKEVKKNKTTKQKTNTKKKNKKKK